VPDELSELIDRLLEKKPSRRPASAAAVRDQLAAMLSRFQQFGPRRRRFGRLRSRRLRRTLLGVGAAALAGAVAIATVYRATTSQPPLPEASPQPSPAELAEAVAQITEEESAFVNELDAARGAVEQPEKSAFSPLLGADDWQLEVEDVKRDLTRLESEQGLSP
jgi:hypothetical protein